MRRRTRTDARIARSASARSSRTEIGGYLRYFGATEGVARVISLAAIEKGDIDLLTELGDTFPDLTRTVAQKISENGMNIAPQQHTAEKNEGNPREFRHDCVDPIGCAYCANIRVVSSIATSDDHHRLSQLETTELFDEPTPVDDKISSANDTFTKLYTPDPQVDGLSRNDIAHIGLPVQVLKGSHVPVEDTLVAINFTPDRISNPHMAHESSQPFYNNDITQVAEAILRSFPEFDFDPETLLRIMVDDIRATRAALAGEAGAGVLQVQRLGTPTEAIEYLQNIKTSLA